MWCVLGLTRPHVADAKGGRGKENTKKNYACIAASQRIFMARKCREWLCPLSN